MGDTLEQCFDVLKNADLFQQIAYGTFLAVLTVFAFMKKSLPHFIRDALKALINALGKK